MDKKKKGKRNKCLGGMGKRMKKKGCTQKNSTEE